MQRFQAAITPQRALRALRDLCPSTPVYCVASAVHVVKPFQPRGRAIIIVFSSQMPLQKVQSYNTFNGALSTAVEKIEFFFDQNRSLCRTEPNISGVFPAYSRTVSPAKIKFGMIIT